MNLQIEVDAKELSPHVLDQVFQTISKQQQLIAQMIDAR
jgi:hypothetical protein